MALFQNPFFQSKSEAVEAEYTAGVEALQRQDFDLASRKFKVAANGGHVSALYNLCLIWGGGYVTPYDFDLAADCWYKSAEAGHPKSKSLLWHLEAADRGGYGAENLVKYIMSENTGDELIPSIMICAARFYDVICRKYGATVDVIAYELDAASMSEHDFVHAFIERTGIHSDFYKGGLQRIKPGSAADQITDGLNNFSIAMRSAGASDSLTVMARCSLVGYIIQKSAYGDNAKPLRGRDTFFESTKTAIGAQNFAIGDLSWSKAPETDDEIIELVFQIAKKLPGILPTEQDTYWFVIEEYDRLVEHGQVCSDVLAQEPLLQIEHRGRRSEQSCVGTKNPGVQYLEDVVSPVLIEQYGDEVGTRLRSSIYVVFRRLGGDHIDHLRIKYAKHYQSNCVTEGNVNSAALWEKVITSLGGHV